MKRSQEADIPTQGRFYTFLLRIAPIIKASILRLITNIHTHRVPLNDAVPKLVRCVASKKEKMIDSTSDEFYYTRLGV